MRDPLAKWNIFPEKYTHRANMAKKNSTLVGSGTNARHSLSSNHWDRDGTEWPNQDHAECYMVPTHNNDHCFVFYFLNKRTFADIYLLQQGEPRAARGRATRSDASAHSWTLRTGSRSGRVGWDFIRCVFARGSLRPIYFLPLFLLHVSDLHHGLIPSLPILCPPSIFQRLSSPVSLLTLSHYLLSLGLHWHTCQIMRWGISDKGYLINCDIISTKATTARP